MVDRIQSVTMCCNISQPLLRGFVVTTPEVTRVLFLRQYFYDALFLFEVLRGFEEINLLINEVVLGFGCRVFGRRIVDFQILLVLLLPSDL